MHLTKWIRKNKKQIMVFVVIFSMLSFILGYAGLQLFFSLFGGANPVIGTYHDGQKIRAEDFMAAQNELHLLRVLSGDSILMAQGQQSLAGPLLAYLLFPDSPRVADMPLILKQAAQHGQVPVGIDRVEDFFSERTQAEVTWILLKAEARQAGMAVSDGASREVLQQLLIQMAEAFGTDVNSLLARTHATESQMVRAFADLLSVIYYVNAVTDSQAVTLNQIQASVGRSKEKLDAEFVEILAEWFIDADAPVAQDKLQQHFETYKTFLPGQVAEDNPYGFGYTLPKRVRLEYMVVLLDQIREQVERPTAEQMETYYTRNIDRFRYQEPANPDDPEGPQVTKTRSFAEAQPQIRNALQQERVDRIAGQVFNDARAMTEQGFSAVNFEEADINQLGAAAGDYMQAATTLSGRYNIGVLTGKTGYLTAGDFQQDPILLGLRLVQGDSQVALADVAFAVERTTENVRRRIGVPFVRPWENIGPMTGGYFDETSRQYHRLMAMVRVVEIEDKSVPASMDVTYSKEGMVILPQQQQDKEATFSLAAQVADDVRLVEAMNRATATADALAALVEEHDWDDAVKLFNEQHAEAEEATVPSIRVRTVRQQERLSDDDMALYRRMLASNPASAGFIQTRLKTNALNNQLYALLPRDEETTGTVSRTLTVNEKQACYVVKRVTRMPATEADYLDGKVLAAMQASRQATAELSLVHLKTKNLFERMGYVAEEQMPMIEAPEPMLPEPGGVI